MVRCVAFAIALSLVAGTPAAALALSAAPCAPRAAGGLSGFTDVREACSALAATSPSPNPTAETDPSWSSEFHIGLGTLGAWIFCATAYEEDLVVGGIIGYAYYGGRSVLARWNGSSWETFADGLTDGEDIALPLALTIYRGDLIAAGIFSEASGQPAAHIARWDGEAWYPLGEGLNGNAGGLLVHDGDLIAVGGFTEAGGITANGIARWDGEAWHALGEGLTGDSPEEWYWMDVVDYEGDLVACGPFHEAGGLPAAGLARWDGSSWATFPSTPAIDPVALTVHEGRLVVGGASWEGADCAVRWDGQQWQPMPPPEPWRIYALVSHNGELLCGGSERGVSYPDARAGRWNGETWEDIGLTSGLYMSRVSAMGVYEDAVFAAGMLYHGAYRWQEDRWQAIGGGGGVSGPVRTLRIFGGRLVAGGEFGWAGGLHACGVAAWNGACWETLGSGFDWPHAYGRYRVQALHEHDGALVAGGVFSIPGVDSVDYIARWDGTAWELLSDSPAARLNDDVRALATYRGDLIAGGWFTVAGTESLRRVARWDGATWQSLGGGTDSGVYALADYKGDLIAGGSFTHAGTIACSRIARWDGTQWHRIGGVGGTFSSNVNALAIYGDDLIVGGDFAYAHLTPANNIARWDGEEWHALGEGSSEEVRALGVYHGQVVAAGSFAFPDHEQTHELARWDGIAWRPLTGAPDGCSDPLDGYVYTLAVFDDCLYLGGEIQAAGGWPSWGVARWSEPLSDWPESRITPLLQSIRPNPMRSETRIEYILPYDTRVEVTVHDASGRRRATLISGEQPQGRYSLEWLGRDETGRRLASGLYFLRLHAGPTAASGRLLLVR